ncbi:MAG: signal peptidase II [Bacilli bacterium]|nr:signal peptidase II [Bacilli bacterium]
MKKRILIITTIILFLDQVSKNIIEAYMNLNDRIDLIPNFFSFNYTNNYGGAWSILNNKVAFLIIITIIIMIIIYRYMNTFKDNMRNNIAFGLLFGGITGNLLDRLFLGYVRDFIAFRIFNYNFPVFNISDMAIVVGTFLLIIAIIKGEDHANKSSK